MEVLESGNNRDAFTDLGGAGDAFTYTETDDPLSTVFLPSSRQPSSPTLRSLLDTYPPLSKHTQPVYLDIPYYLFLFTNPVQHALNTPTTTAPEPINLRTLVFHRLCAPDNTILTGKINLPTS